MRSLLGNVAFRRLFVGRLVTNAGDSLYAVAAMWLVFELTGSTFYTGLAGALTMGPQALQAFVGPLVDRWPLRRLLVGIQVTQAVVVLVVPAAWLLGVRSVELVLVVVPALSMLNQFVYPAQSAALPRIVDDDELADANAAFSFAYQGADLVFNALAGALIALFGAVALYAIDSLTFLVAAVLFAGVVVPAAGAGDTATHGAEEAPSAGDAGDAVGDDPAAGPAETDGGESDGSDRGEPDGYLDRLRGGAAFVRGTPLVWLLGAGVLTNGLLGVSTAVLPAFADTMGGAGAYGAIRAATAEGLLVGALLGSKLDHVGFARLFVPGFLLSAAGWFAALFAPTLPLTALCFALALLPVGATNVLVSTLIQRMVPDDFLGRVSAILGSASVAVMPIGSLLGGTLGETVGVWETMAAGGFGLLWIAVYVAAVPTLRRLPPVSEARTIAA
ncbi:MFS transporter [Halorarum halobium]|uniref:MFS transporter n=1 Tax=Halorarum halobium TaxID=3075121 RepID=UPI0028B126A0|nr:MFS transporter [Halobaculum sp. XH14]